MLKTILLVKRFLDKFSGAAVLFLKCSNILLTDTGISIFNCHCCKHLITSYFSSSVIVELGNVIISGLEVNFSVHLQSLASKIFPLANCFQMFGRHV